MECASLLQTLSGAVAVQGCPIEACTDPRLRRLDKQDPPLPDAGGQLVYSNIYYEHITEQDALGPRDLDHTYTDDTAFDARPPKDDNVVPLMEGVEDQQPMDTSSGDVSPDNITGSRIGMLAMLRSARAQNAHIERTLRTEQQNLSSSRNNSHVRCKREFNNILLYKSVFLWTDEMVEKDKNSSIEEKESTDEESTSAVPQQEVLEPHLHLPPTWVAFLAQMAQVWNRDSFTMLLAPC